MRDTYLNIIYTIEKSRQNSASATPGTRVIGASKGQSVEQIETAIACGVNSFGENRVQEAAEKWPDLKTRFPEVELQLIGPLQTNKAREACALFDVIATLDRQKLADALAEERTRSGACPALLIQVNTGEEPQKAGVAPREADAFIRYCRDTLALPVTGLMCIPPADALPAPHFALLATIAKRNGLSELSMGMSGDYAIAAALGATQVRIGTALFGARG